MTPLNDEARLALTLLLNAGAFGGAYCFARRHGGGSTLQALCDAFLASYVIQYVSVAVPGMFGVFNLLTMSLVALAASATLGFFGLRNRHDLLKPGAIRPGINWTFDHFILVGCFVFVIAYAAVHVNVQRLNPPAATDALVYHLPTAVQWIQTHRLGLFPTWYWNPAATWSPATTSTFMAWLMQSTGNDVFARFVQAPVVPFIFLLVARIAREFGCTRAVAGIVALAAAMSRPFISEAIIPKDDLFVTAFFGAAVVSLARDNLRDRFGPWRVGLAFGMVLACKYTILLACPLFLFMIDAPFRAGWRVKHWAIALALGAVLFAPWYVRNIVITGNPLYPVDVKLFGHTIFTGLFGTERDQELRTAGGVWKMLGTTYHSLPWPVVSALAVTLVAGIATARRSMLIDPLRRACLIGTIVTFVLFVLTSPHHEVRYMYPLLLLIFGAAGLPIAHWIPLEPARLAVASVLAIASIATAFDSTLIDSILAMLVPAVIVTLAAVGVVVAQCRVFKLDIRGVGVSIGIALFLAAMPTYVFWSAYVDGYYRKSTDGHGIAGISYVWQGQYADEAPLWTFVREMLPDDANIAIANTFFVYPFFDKDFHRHLGHAPVRRGLHDFVRFPRMGETVPGDVIVQRMTDVMNEDPDKATWLENLHRMNAEYLVLASFPHTGDVPERRFVAEEPATFEKLFDDPVAGSVYRIHFPR